MNSILKEVESTTKNQILSGRITDKQNAMDAFAANLIAAINKAQVSPGSKENTFSFTKLVDLWIPSNTESYISSIAEMSMN